MRLSTFAIICVSAVISFAAHPQAPTVSDPAVTAAEKAYSAQDWTAAESDYAALAAQQPDNGRFWYRLGVSARANKHYDVAIPAMQKAKVLGNGKGFPTAFADYEIATTYAGAGNPSQALESLKASANGGFSQTNRLSGDAEWNSLRSNDQFIALEKQVKHNASPCEGAEFRQLDFWVGDWDVATAAGSVRQGTSHVSREMGGCVVWENWTSAGGQYFGKSYNTWNPNLKRWEQYWVDTGAGVMFFHGSLKDSTMDYWTDDVPQATGGTLLRHLQFFNLGPDKVRQFSQGSTDGGKTWYTEYDFIYTRVAKKS